MGKNRLFATEEDFTLDDLTEEEYQEGMERLQKDLKEEDDNNPFSIN